MPKEMTILQWLAPSMARDGLITNCDWIPPACATAVGLFSDNRLHLPATLLAALSPYAIDYLQQAPALVLAATGDARLMLREERLKVARQFIAACGHGPRLNELMKTYGLATPLRALSGHALRHKHWDLLTALSTLPASALAQSIPKTLDQQRNWLEALARWRLHTGRRFNNGELLLGWAAANLGDARYRRYIGDIADFAGSNFRTFNPRWTLEHAKAASDRWHAAVALRPFGFAAMAPDWEKPIDYAPLPSQLEAEGFTFHALQTRHDIYIEGELMHHCVRTYADRVAAGHSRLYSVRLNGQRVATLELWQAGRFAPVPTRYEQAQLKGPCNARVPKEVAAAVAVFVRRANDIVRSRLEQSPAPRMLPPPAQLQPIRFPRRVRFISG
jgi:hypothetical protein